MPGPEIRQEVHYVVAAGAKPKKTAAKSTAAGPSGASNSSRSQFVAEVSGFDPATGLSRLMVKNKFRVGDEMELVSPRGNRRFCLQTLLDKHGQTIDEALGGGWEVQAKLPGDPGEMALLTRFFA
jgi:putative protease